MDRDFWLARWEKGQIGFHQPTTHEALLRHWGDLRVPRGARVLVPLCGKSRDMLWLASRGHDVVGVELSPLATRAFFAENDLTPHVEPAGAFERWRAGSVEILLGDLFDLAPAHVAGVTAAYDRAALVALPPALRERYAARMRDLLPPGAATLLVTTTYREDEMQGPPFPVREEEVRRLYADAFDVERLASWDALDADPRWRERGLSEFGEHAFRLRRRA